MAELLYYEPNEADRNQTLNALSQAGYETYACRSLSELQLRLATRDVLCAIAGRSAGIAEQSTIIGQCAAAGKPLLLLTTQKELASRLHALSLENCDVLLCPFEMRTLLEHLEQLLARALHTLTAGELVLDLEKKSGALDGRDLCLTAQEFSLLQALMLSGGAVLSRQQLLCRAWGYDGVGITRTVDVHVQRLRAKMGKEYIQTVYRAGYRLCA